MSHPIAGSAAPHERYLTFMLGEEEYAVPIRVVQEIISVLPATPVPGTPRFVLGVVNLRGAIVPVIDLRRRFDMPEIERTRDACIIVTRTGPIVTGFLADRVCEVVNVPKDAIQHPQSFGSPVHTQYVQGIAAHQRGARILLDADALTASAVFGLDPASPS